MKKMFLNYFILKLLLLKLKTQRSLLNLVQIVKYSILIETPSYYNSSAQVFIFSSLYLIIAITSAKDLFLYLKIFHHQKKSLYFEDCFSFCYWYKIIVTITFYFSYCSGIKEMSSYFLIFLFFNHYFSDYYLGR